MKIDLRDSGVWSALERQAYDEQVREIHRAREVCAASASTAAHCAMPP